MIGLFCRIQSLLQSSFAQETYNFKEPTLRVSCVSCVMLTCVTCLVHRGAVGQRPPICDSCNSGEPGYVFPVAVSV